MKKKEQTGKRKVDVLIVGVGGQGNILAGKIISQAFVAEGYDVKQSEVHGMAQRGGAVSSHVRAGEKVYSPLIPLASADYLLSFERLETLRYLDYAHSGTTAVINDLRLDPPAVSAGKAKYPEDVLETVAKKTKNILVVASNRIAYDLGNERVANSVLVGVLARQLPLRKQVWKKMYEQNVRAELLAINLKAFEAGFNLCDSDEYCSALGGGR